MKNAMIIVRNAKPALLGMLLLSSLVGGLPSQSAGQANDASVGGTPGTYRVGHSLIQKQLTGSVGEKRLLNVHVWYPARNEDYANALRTVYTSALYGVPLIPGTWDPLAWTVVSDAAREDVEIKKVGQPFPVVVFSHGSNGEAIQYGKTLEALASRGFVVAAPDHIGNAQDDVRVDFINTQAGFKLLGFCADGRTSPCVDPSVPRSMANRSLDVEAVAQAVGALFGGQVDIDQIGVFGHSRGTVTALTMAGGSSVWNLAPNPRVKAIMGLANGDAFSVNLGAIQIPTLLVAGGQDHNSPAAITEAAFDAIPSPEKLLVILGQATHRHFNSTMCDEMQGAGSVAAANPRAILDRRDFTRIIRDPVNGSGPDYCTFRYFTSPADIRPLVKAVTGFDVTESNVPVTGLSADETAQVITELSSTFFGTVLGRHGASGDHFTRFLAPKYLTHHEPSVASAEAFAGADAICPSGLDVACDD
jgi:predicted dienelactone hydrolase